MNSSDLELVTNKPNGCELCVKDISILMEIVANFFLSSGKLIAVW